MGWIRPGESVTVDYHVYAGGAWRVVPWGVNRMAPVNVWVSADRMAPVVYRHQAGECRGECRLVCGHPLTYGCDCDTIAVEAGCEHRFTDYFTAEKTGRHCLRCGAPEAAPDV